MTPALMRLLARVVREREAWGGASGVFSAAERAELRAFADNIFAADEGKTMTDESKDTIAVGDLVRLRSGGPTMTVEEIADERALRCAWFGEGDAEVKRSSFDPATIITKKWERAAVEMQEKLEATIKHYNGELAKADARIRGLEAERNAAMSDAQIWEREARDRGYVSPAGTRADLSGDVSKPS